MQGDLITSYQADPYRLLICNGLSNELRDT